MIALSIVIGLSVFLHSTPATASSIPSIITAVTAPLSLSSPVAWTDSAATTDDKENMFVDVPRGDWTYAAVALLQDHGIFLGYPADYYSGKRVLTRYEFAVAVNRCMDNVLPVAPRDPTSALETPAGGREVRPEEFSAWKTATEDIKLLRRLCMEFKQQLIALGKDWKAADTSLLKMQDQKLHAEIASALAAVTPKTEEALPSSAFRELKHPHWAYDAIQQLERKKIVVMTPSDAKPSRSLTRYEFAVMTKRCLDTFPRAEKALDNTANSNESSPVYELTDVVALHKLARAFRSELSQLGTDWKAAETMLTQAEEKRILVEETIDTKPPAIK